MTRADTFGRRLYPEPCRFILSYHPCCLQGSVALIALSIIVWEAVFTAWTSAERFVRQTFRTQRNPYIPFIYCTPLQTAHRAQAHTITVFGLGEETGISM